MVEAHAPASTDKGERLLKCYMVSSVNEWGAEQTRILLVRRVCVCVCVRACVPQVRARVVAEASMESSVGRRVRMRVRDRHMQTRHTRMHCS